jgi:hypothetical protein
MNRFTKGITSVLAIALLGLAGAAQAQKVRSVADDYSSRVSDGRSGVPPGMLLSTDSMPMKNWQATPTIKTRKSTGAGKAATDIVSVYRPLPLCRLMDTRGPAGPLGAPLLAANNGRIINPAGACGIPTFSVAALSISITTQNTTPANGGYLTFIRTAASPVAGTNLVFAPGAEYASTTANISTADNASFVAYVANSNVQLVIDVNGYFQDVNTLDSNTEMDILGDTAGDLLQISNSNATGSALTASAGSTTATALAIGQGRLRSPGAGVNTPTFAFQFSVNTAGTASAGTGTGCFAGLSDIHVITHPMLDNNPGAIVFITPKLINGGGDGTHAPAAMYRALYLSAAGSCGGGTGANKWSIQNVEGTNIANAAKFNILVISP